MRQAELRWPGLVAVGAMLSLGLACRAHDTPADSSSESVPAPVASSETGVPEAASGSDAAATAVAENRVPDPPIPVMTREGLLAALEAGDGPVILDVRIAEEYEAAHVPGAINVPYDQVAANLDSLETFRTRGLVVYCRSGRRAGEAQAVLQQAGFDLLWDLEGHMVKWKAYELPLAGTCC